MAGVPKASSVRSASGAPNASGVAGRFARQGRKTLASKVFQSVVCICALVAIAVTAAVTVASYRVFEEDSGKLLLSQAQSYAAAYGSLSPQEAAVRLGEVPFSPETRCTLVASDGQVLYDTFVNPQTLGNHGDREEIVAARAQGSTVSMRRSDTLGTSTLYAAVLMDNGAVIRLAEPHVSAGLFLRDMAVPLVVTLVLALVASYVVSRILVRSVVRPLREIDLAHPAENQAYQELQPLLARVDEQRCQLEAHNEELERAVNLRREFAGNVSHEMKTPLQVIGGYAELMENSLVPPEEVPRFAGLIRTESESMRRLIDDVLTLSRLDERVDAGSTVVGLGVVCRRVAGRLEAAAAERGETFELDLDDVAMVFGDEVRCEQMVYNLAANAIAYNKEAGRVRIALRAEDDQVVLSVSDEGPGVPEALRERVFERFFRVDASRSRETGGTGLGLAIVKHAAESLGGSVAIQDGDLGGAEFVVRMPRARME